MKKNLKNGYVQYVEKKIIVKYIQIVIIIFVKNVCLVGLKTVFEIELIVQFEDKNFEIIVNLINITNIIFIVVFCMYLLFIGFLESCFK